MDTNKDKIQQEILQSIKENNFNGTIIALTGIGKARVMVEVIKMLKPKNVLYLCDNKVLRDKTFNEQVRRWGGAEFLGRITLACYQTAFKWENREYDLILADEADFAISPKYIRALSIPATYKLLFTGTMSDDKLRIVTKFSPVIHTVSVKEAENRQAINKMAVTIVTFRLSPLENYKYLEINKTFKNLLSQPNSRGVQLSLKSLQLRRKLFLSSLESLKSATRRLMASLEQDPNSKTLIFCGTVEQAKATCKWSYHGESKDDSNLDKFDKGIIRFLAVVDKINRGVNINGVNNIIFSPPPRSKTKLMQQSGRGRRLHSSQTTRVYCMVPYFRSRVGVVKPTVIHDYVLNSGEELDLENATTIHYG